jgi:hypothetical protein
MAPNAAPDSPARSTRSKTKAAGSTSGAPASKFIAGYNGKPLNPSKLLNAQQRDNVFAPSSPQRFFTSPNSLSLYLSLSNSPSLSPTHSVKETLTFLAGLAFLIPFGPFVAWQIFWCSLWEFVDKKTINLSNDKGIIARACDVINPHLARFTRHPKDGFVIILLVYLGALMPAAFFYELHHAYTFGFSIKRCLIFNLVRIGPQYANFMWVYVMCHKEGHCIGGSLLKRGILHNLFGGTFNYWVGPFHGVVPGVFTVSHIHNHHKYDNDENDVYSTAYRPRDDFSSWVKYVPEWMAYATNVSSFIFFIREKSYGKAFKTFVSTLYYVALLCAVAAVNKEFCFWYLFYPLVEGNILLSIVNYTWHAFIDPSDPSNDYVNSTTVIEGQNFCLKEEYHVVHHQYAGVHWSKHRELYEKHLPEYKKVKATIFYAENLFVIFGAIVAKDYNKLAELYFEPESTGMTKQQIADMMRDRLRTCGPEIAKNIGRTADMKKESEQFMTKDKGE